MGATMRFGTIDRLAIFGGSWLMAALCQILVDRGMTIQLFSSPRHLNEKVEKNGTTLREVVTGLGIAYCSTDDINTERMLPEFVTPTTLGLAAGAAWVFERETAKLFGGKLLDFMGIALPQYRGGAHYSWQILRKNRQGSCNLQLIHGGQDTFHRGEIIKRKDYFFPASVRIPQDYFDAAIPHEVAFLNEFLDELAQEKEYDLQPIQENFSTYFPSLYTPQHGFIDWRWSTDEIERFICAFDLPYAGASTFVAEQHVFLRDCYAEYSDGSFHQFQAGLIYRKTDTALYVAAGSGTIVVRGVSDEHGSNLLPILQLGQRFYTPFATLDTAMQFGAVYDAKGLQNQNEKEQL